jgi:prepilin-type N-terminal cleavage/methylation domain-containing protein
MKSIWKLGRSGVAVGRRKAFTLIELLVVVSIILILMGISLKVMSIVNRRGSTARTEWILQQVKNALGAYYSLYGTYPPTDTVKFVYKFKLPPEEDVNISPDALGWKTGLVYYIFSGDQHNPEAAPWQHFLEGIGSGIEYPSGQAVTNNQTWGFTNRSHTLADAWGREIHYRSVGPDYQSYVMWSDGPNGISSNGVDDDIGVQWTD